MNRTERDWPPCRVDGVRRSKQVIAIPSSAAGPARSLDLCYGFPTPTGEPYLAPVESFTFIGMMEDALDVTPLALKPGEPEQAEDIPTAMHEPPQVTSLDTTTQLRAAFESYKNSKGLKRARAAAVTWDEKSTLTLLKVYEEQWTHIKKGNLRTKDWEDLTYALNKEIDGSFNLEHARNRIDTLKKTYKKEVHKMNSTGSSPSTWPLFDMCAALWGTIPKCTDITGPFETDGVRPSSAATEIPADLDGLEGGSTSQNPHVETAEQVDLDGVCEKKAKPSKRSSLGAVARTMGDGMREMWAAYERAEEKRTATLRELEMNRMAHEERLVRIKEEEETRRQQMFFATQLEIAKLLARRQD
ncbi:hypothetical protein L7F22_031947 [Adiantum nelumboides]|nr:hypothetical protein [Adiantum nelumboides]